MCPQSASRKCWLFADVFWKPSILSAALALGNTSFLSLSLNLNCKGSAFSQGTGAEGHCGVLGRISQVSTPHPWSPPSGWSGSHFPRCSHVVSLPWECCLSAATPGADGTNVFWTTGKGGCRAGCFSPASLQEELGTGFHTSTVCSFFHSKDTMSVSHAVNACSQPGSLLNSLPEHLSDSLKQPQG